MKIKVTKDNVTIDKGELYHAGEYNIHDCIFEFSEEYTDILVKKALFGVDNKFYEMSILNNQCEVPYDVLKSNGMVILGVYAYEVLEDKLKLRYSPMYDKFFVNLGSYQENIENQEEITPTQFEQYMQALQNGLADVQSSIDKLNKTTDNANNLIDDINKKLESGEFDGVGITTITSGGAIQQNDNTITPVIVNKTDGSQQTFNVSAKNGINGTDGTDGTNGQDGITPNLQIGTVTTLEPNEQATVTRTGTDEEPLFNFGIPRGQTYQVNNEDLKNIANQITSNANSEFNKNVDSKTTAFNNNAVQKTLDYNNNCISKTNSFNQNSTQKLTEFNDNYTSKLNSFNSNADLRMDEYNSNADNKIAEYDEHSQELNNKIVSTRNELERVKNDVLETGTDTDTYIHLEDSAMAEYQELSVDGVCEQETINLVDGYIESTSNVYKSNYFDTGVRPTKDTAIEVKINIPSDSTKSYDRILGSQSPYFFIGRDGKDSNIIKILKGNGQLDYRHTFVYDKDFTIKIDTNGLYIDGELVSSYDVGGNYMDRTIWLFSCNRGDRDGAFKLYYCNIWENGELIKSFKPVYSNKYGGCLFEEVNNEIYYNKGNTKLLAQNISQDVLSPSPDYPQPISTIENSLKITSCNKNLFKMNDNYSKGYTTTKNGITLKVEDDLSITLKGTATAKTAFSLFGVWGIKNNRYIPKGIFTISQNGFVDGITSNLGFFKNGVNVQNYGLTYIKTSSLFNSLLIEFDGMSYSISIADGKTIDIRVYTQIENDTKATSYEQHLETLIEANLPEGEFIGKINDTNKDTLKVEYNEEDGQYHLNLYKNIGKVVLDGSENWLENRETKGLFQVTKSNVISSLNEVLVKSTHFRAVTGQYLSDNASTEDLITSNFTSNRLMFIYKQYANNLTDFKTWLSTHNTEVYYALATPYVVDLGVIDQLISYDKVSNVFTNSDLLPQINAKYYRNFITTVRNLQVNEKALKQELADINTRLSALETATTNVASESEVVE